MNLSGPLNSLTFVLVAFIALENASAQDGNQPRVNPFELPPGIIDGPFLAPSFPPEIPQPTKLRWLLSK